MFAHMVHGHPTHPHGLTDRVFLQEIEFRHTPPLRGPVGAVDEYEGKYLTIHMLTKSSGSATYGLWVKPHERCNFQLSKTMLIDISEENAVFLFEIIGSSEEPIGNIPLLEAIIVPETCTFCDGVEVAIDIFAGDCT